MGAWRPALMGRHGVVASAHPLASAAGLRMLEEGGNAVDAAVAVAAALNVAEPYMSGLGGDGYMLITLPGASRPLVLDYNGSVPREADPAAYTKAEQQTGPKAPLVPGAPAGWLTALERYGSMSPAEVFAPAIDYAEHGAPVTYKNTEFIAGAAERIRAFPLTAATFLPGGHPPRPGSLLRQPKLARTYRVLAEEGAHAFYHGEIGDEIVRAVRAAGGVLSTKDLAEFAVAWQEPLAIDFRGYRVFAPPPPAAAIEYLELLRIVEPEDLRALGHNSAAYLHLLIEADKLAGADRIKYTMSGVDPQTLLSDSYVDQQRRRLSRDVATLGQSDHYAAELAGAVRAGNPAAASRDHTTHFGAADASGMAVNVTQSIGSPFGSAFMAGETGIMLNNFVNWTDLDRASPNAMQPGKKMENCMS
ncbi:MAG TPA: gamma-glutamyltransferase, partial [Thermomicrobiaceae bacterium]|nr:gamma-glutamyltransferase [Thermomicrobiaceae bacterium]